MKRKIIGSITLVCLLLFTLNTSALANVDNNLENYVENEPVFGKRLIKRCLISIKKI